MCFFPIERTTFCRNRSNLSHFNRVTSCFKPSICIFVSGATIILFDATTPSKHIEHAFVVASADDIDSKPVSLSTYVAPPSKGVNTLRISHNANSIRNVCTHTDWRTLNKTFSHFHNIERNRAPACIILNK